MRVALAQISSTPDIEGNLACCTRLTSEAADLGAKWVLFPENAPFIGPQKSLPQIAEAIDGPIVGHFIELAQEYGLWITLGSFTESSDAIDRTYNTQVLINPAGRICAQYRKLHLFDVAVGPETTFCESKFVKAGDDLVVTSIAGDPTWNVGLSICYDLRFPELYRALCERGAHIVTVPAAFTLQTGRDHWDALLRARAIENQCYVLAPNQWGNHIPGRDSYGHSAIYDPWGDRIATASNGIGLVTADLDTNYLRDIRQRLPCLEHRRRDVYDVSTAEHSAGET